MTAFRIVAVSGGTGFLGSHVIAELAKAGYAGRALSRRTGFDALRPDPASLEGCEAVVNLVGIKREEGRQTFQRVHVEAVERLIGAMKAGGVRRLVHISVVVAREAPDLPYHHTKWLGEKTVAASGLDWTILRPGVIYGTGDDMLSHLTFMIRSSPVFPIVNDGSAPMMPVDAQDVAAAVVGALGHPASVGRTYDIVGPDRLTLRGVVERVAEANGLPVRIWSTPVALMRLPVRIMETTMREPLSTRAQLNMLVEGLAGDPEPARRELGLNPALFTPERLRPIVCQIQRRAPFDLRLFSAPKPEREIGAPVALGIFALIAALISIAFRGVNDPWVGMLTAMGTALGSALLYKPVRRRLVPSVVGVLIGLIAAAFLYGATAGTVAVACRLWTGWADHVRVLDAWKRDHGIPFMATTLVVIIAGEELFWRGVVTRFAMGRFGRAGGIAAGAALYTIAHLASLNPLLLGAALLCGLFWGWLYAATDNLTAPFVCHLAWDAMVLFVAPVVA